MPDLTGHGEETVTAAFEIARLTSNPGFRARMRATGRGPDEAVVPVAWETTVGDMLSLAQHWLPGAVVVAVADEAAPHGFRLLRVTEMEEW